MVKRVQIEPVASRSSRATGRKRLYHGLGRGLIGGLAFLFLSAIPVSALGQVIQNSATGTSNGVSLDLANATSTLNRTTGNAVTQAFAEIAPNAVAIGSMGNAFVYDILPTINAGDSGVDEIVLTVPAGYTNLTVSTVAVGGTGQVQNCPTPGTGEYCATVAGSVITVTLGSKVTTSLTNLRIGVTADAPGSAGSANFTSTVDDSTTSSVGSQATFAGNADGDSTDADSLTVQVEGNAVSAVSAEIAPNAVAIGSTGNAFVYDILPTINAGDSGVDEIVLTVPAGYTNLAVSTVTVGGTGQVQNCPTPGAGEYCATVAGSVITVTLGSKVTTSLTNLRIGVTADAPGSAGSANFTSTVDDSTTSSVGSQATFAGNADGDPTDADSLTVQVEGNAVSAVLAEISPNAVAIGSTGNVFIYDYLPTINAGDTGLDRMVLTVPAGYTNLAVSTVTVGGTGQVQNCPTPGAGEYCATVAGSVITVTLGSKVTTSLTNLRIGVTADAPGSAGSAVFASTVEDTSTATVSPQPAVAGDADGDGSDPNSLTVSVGDRAVSAVIAEIDPNTIVINSTGNAFTYDLRPTINPGDTGLDAVAITAPAGYSNPAVTSVSIGGSLQTANCPTPGSGEYCVTVSGQVVTITLGTAVGTSLTPMRVGMTVDAPSTANSSDFNASVDDTLTPTVAPQSAVAGNADGDPSDANSLTVTVRSVDPDQSILQVNPDIVEIDRDADGDPFSTVTVIPKDGAGNDLGPGLTVILTATSGGAPFGLLTPVVDNGDGTYTARISSPAPGVATLSAVVNGVTLTSLPQVSFTQGLVLRLTKAANKREAAVGDVVTYTIEVKNTTTDPVQQVKVDDRIPPNFKYLKGSSRIDGQLVADPAGNRTLTFDIGTVAALNDINANGVADPGEDGYLNLTYRLVIGSGATPRDYVNTAVAKDSCDLCRISNTDQARVTVSLDPIFDLGTIIGKVFEDQNGDGWQDRGEPGIAGVMVVLDEGTYALTDEHGRYHFPAVRPGQRMVKVNLTLLTDGAKTSTPESRVVSVTPGLLAKANFGVIYPQETEAIGSPPEWGLSITSDGKEEPIEVVGSVENQTLLINGQPTALPGSSVRLGMNRLEDIVEMKGGRLEEPVAFRLRIDRPDMVETWYLRIRDGQGRTVRTFAGDGAPPEGVHWDGLDDEGRPVQGGELYQYQIDVAYDDGSRSSSALRLFGVNRTTAISLSLTGSIFEVGSAVLSEAAKAILKDAAETLRRFPEEEVIIEGHTDATGSEPINMELSERRAQAAVDYLVSQEGLPADRFVVRGYGSARPIADNAYAEGREMNRRVEVNGEFKEVERSKLLDQYRARPEVRINQSEIPVDAKGRFAARLPMADRLDLKMANTQGRSIETTVSLPRLELFDLYDKRRLPYGTEQEGFRVSPHPNKGRWEENDIAMVFTLRGKTDPGNTVELDGRDLSVGPDGGFTTDLSLKVGSNPFGLLVRNPEGYSRIANLLLTVRDRDADGQLILAVKPIPTLTVHLPPRDVVLHSPLMHLVGRTDPGNRVEINGDPVEVRSEGDFATTVKLPKGESVLRIKVVDPEGYEGIIERKTVVNDTQLFFLAFADGKIGQMYGKGYLEGAGMNASTEFYSEGRIAYYLKGVISGKYLITSAFDTGSSEFGDLFQDLDQGDEDRLLTNLDPDRLYPVYGDASTVVYDTESQGKFYLALDGPTFNLLLGNGPVSLTGTELSAYQRTLYGGRLTYRSASQTAYGQPDTEVILFGAEVRQAHVRDELTATGGSLYYLSHRDLIEGSEQVSLVVRDQQTGLVLSRTPQQANVDYTIKYPEGRILFHRPIQSVIAGEGLIDVGPLSGNPVIIQVDYETKVDSFEKTAVGGRVRRQLGDHLSVGGSYVKDELDLGAYELKGVDAEVRLGRGSRIVGEYASSSGADALAFVSSDGGLTYNEVTPNGSQDGGAWKLAAELDLGEWIDQPERLRFKGYLKRLEGGFVSSGNFLEQGTDKLGASLSFRPTNADRILARYEQEDGRITGSRRLNLQWRHRWDRWELTGEYQAENQDGVPGQGDGSLAAIRLSGRLTEKWTASLEHQQTLSGRRNDQTTVDLEYQLLPALALQLRGMSGSDGDAAQAGAVWTAGEGRIYLSERLSDDRAGRRTATVVGGERSLGSAGKLYSEYQWEHAEEGDRTLSLIGLQRQWSLTQGWRLLLSGEHSRADAPAMERITGGLGLSYANGIWKGSTREEIRLERGGVKRNQYLTVNHLELKLNGDFTLIGKYRYGLTRDEDTGRIESRFEERSVGLAYRPTETDRFNALARYTRLMDQRPVSLEEVKAVSDVASVEWSWQISRYLEWVEKDAAKIKTETSAGYPAVKTHTYLSIHRLNVAIWRAVELGVEYRMLWQREAQDRRQGWLTELGWRPARHLRLGLGFNFTDFSDNEFSENDYSAYGWFIRLQAMY